MMRCSEILRRLGELAPERYAAEWDNPGLLVGRPEKRVEKVYLAVDATDEVIDHAAEKGADLLLTHHPMIFRALKKVTSDDFVSRRVIELIRQDISLCAMHTNFDVACMGEAAAEELDLKDTEVLQPLFFTGNPEEDQAGNPEEDQAGDQEEGQAGNPGANHSGRNAEGYGRVGSLPCAMKLSSLAEYVKTVFGLSHVRLFGNPEETAERAAVLPGSGASGIPDAIRMDADVLITGDISHHEGIDAVMQGLAIIDAGHYGIENIFIDYMQAFFREKMPEITVYTEEEEIPFRVL